MENEELFNFMEKMYGEMQKGFTEIKDDITEIKCDITDLRNGQLRLEDRLEDTRKTLFDGYNQNYETSCEIKELVMKNTNGIEEINIAVSEMKEDINFIASRTIRNDSKIDKINEKLRSVI